MIARDLLAEGEELLMQLQRGESPRLVARPLLLWLLRSVLYILRRMDEKDRTCWDYVPGYGRLSGYIRWQPGPEYLMYKADADLPATHRLRRMP